MNSTWLKRLGAASGALYVVLAFLKNGGSNSPNFQASQQEIVTWAKSVQLTPTFWIGPYVGLLGLLFFLVFVAYLSSVLSRAEGEFGWLSTSVSAGCRGHRHHPRKSSACMAGVECRRDCPGTAWNPAAGLLQLPSHPTLTHGLGIGDKHRPDYPRGETGSIPSKPNDAAFRGAASGSGVNY